MFRTGALATLLLIAACGPAEIGRENAHAYFDENRTVLEGVVEQVRQCQIESGRIDLSDRFFCRTVEGDPEGLRDAMAAADVKWLRAFYEDSQEGEVAPLASIHIAVRSSGFSFAGTSEEFIYEFAAAPEAEYERENIGEAVIERQPVTDAPHHWYWRKIDR